MPGSRKPTVLRGLVYHAPMRDVKVLGVLGLTVACLAWALWGMDLGGAAAAFRAFDARWLVAFAACSLVVLLSRAVRLWLLIATEARFVDVLLANQAGLLAINVVPFRMGELVRPYLLADRFGVPFGVGMAAVVLERLLDMLALLALLTWVAWFADLPAGIAVGGVDLLLAGQRAMGVGVLGGLAGVGFLAIAGPSGVGLVSRVGRALVPPLEPALTRLASTLVDGFRGLFARPLAAVGAVASTVVMWGGTIVACAAVMSGFHDLPVHPELVAVNWTATVTALALLPTPGFVGSWEAGSVASLVVYGVADEVAQAYSLLNHALMFAFTGGTGALALAVLGRTLGDVVANSRASN